MYFSYNSGADGFHPRFIRMHRENGLSPGESEQINEDSQEDNMFDTEEALQDHLDSLIDQINAWLDHCRNHIDSIENQEARAFYQIKFAAIVRDCAEQFAPDYRDDDPNVASPYFFTDDTPAAERLLDEMIIYIQEQLLEDGLEIPKPNSADEDEDEDVETETDADTDTDGEDTDHSHDSSIPSPSP